MSWLAKSLVPSVLAREEPGPKSPASICLGRVFNSLLSVFLFDIKVIPPKYNLHCEFLQTLRDYSWLSYRSSIIEDRAVNTNVKKYQHLKHTPNFVVIPTLRTPHSIVFCFTL